MGFFNDLKADVKRGDRLAEGRAFTSTDEIRAAMSGSSTYSDFEMFNMLRLNTHATLLLIDKLDAERANTHK